MASDVGYGLSGDRKSPDFSYPAPPPLVPFLTPKKSNSQISLDDVSDITITVMTLRKPTEIRKIIDSVPKPIRAVPKNGLPFWYRMGLESKLPVPKMPVGKIIFSRGKIGEDVSIAIIIVYKIHS